ncbi:MAG: gamma-glutamyltransferase [Vicinamibacterales bacterium]|jgi:gamma-glutamyltranspeptidase/glutathione hydrolase|nr:gamma-glutamyltransferase [Acidobacteriota bacterium]MDP7293843.1 gamma-glutamyltransferase [Vicinamibacterales bacterium]MDP7671224.1 gamma-glutamyltransferase [Vicinamibacterales bacterium]HJO38420.1 gamma-glutamyltransferase [Vicinamibacterales bacterium]
MHIRSVSVTHAIALALVVVSLGASAAAQEDGSPFPFDTKRSAVIGHRGVVATSQPLASNAGLDILKQGGNAIDAAIATAAVLTVTEPHSTALGGDMFAMVYLEGEKKLLGLNGSGRSSYSMTLDALMGRLDEQEMDRIGGIYSVSVPGAVDGWFTLLAEYGTMTMAEVLAPALHYAEHGFHVTERIGEVWAGSEEKLRREPSAAATWLVDGKAPRIGDLFVNPGLAKTLKMIAEGGRDAFYRGPIAEAIVAYSDSKNGFFTMQDFEEHTSTWVEPLSTDYKNYTLYELPPNGQGIAALEMVNTLGNADLGALGHNSTAYLHHLIEAKKLAYADLDQWVGDPDQNELPVDVLTSTGYGRSQFARIDPDRAQQLNESGLPERGDTVYLTVMDEDHNAVSFIYSIFSSFGSGLVVPDSGITLQNRAALFSLEEGHVNVAAPHKRPFHTIIPAMAFKDEEFFMSFGVMGGAVQPQQHVQVFLNVVEFGMNMQQALEVPRVNHNRGMSVTAEPGIDSAVLDALEAMGHELRRRSEIGGVGGGQGIIFDRETGAMIGGSSHHKDGIAVAY